MLQSSEDGDGTGGEQISIMGEDMCGGGQGPDCLACEETEGFGREGGGASKRGFKEAGEKDFGVCGAGG